MGSLGLQAKGMTGLRIYINPGRGGWDSDNRNVAIATTPAVKLYPNPANDQLHIQSETPVQQAWLYNLAGSCIASTTETTIDVSHLPAGTYLLKIQTTESEYSYPVLIVHGL